MKQITVSGAIILRTREISTGSTSVVQKEIFATQRSYGDYKDGWEIPGGKLEPGETPGARSVPLAYKRNFTLCRLASC